MGFDLKIRKERKTIHYELSHNKPFGKNIVDSKTLKLKRRAALDKRASVDSYSVGRSDKTRGEIGMPEMRDGCIYCTIKIE